MILTFYTYIYIYIFSICPYSLLTPNKVESSLGCLRMFQFKLGLCGARALTHTESLNLIRGFPKIRCAFKGPYNKDALNPKHFLTLNLVFWGL